MIPEDQSPQQQARGSYIAQASGGGQAIVSIYQVPGSVEDISRQRLLAKVEAFWITGFLEQSLHGVAMIELQFERQSVAVENPWRLVVQETGQAALTLPANTSIIQVYDHAEGELLILGMPGSGKTTLLLQLARELIRRANEDRMQPIPVVFNLASWAVKCQPLDAWLVGELHEKYGVPLKLGQLWVADNRVLPLLDGLDEVSESKRAGCVEAINIYKEERGLAAPMVVCSRLAEYEALARIIRLTLHLAITVQPLTMQQIDSYLASGEEKLQGVRTALQQDSELRELAATPLMLSVLTLTYAGRPAGDLLRANHQHSRLHQVFAAYTEQMLHRRGVSQVYTPQQTTCWLSWLANRLKRHSQGEFYLEHMQPDWLKPGAQSWLYAGLVRLSIGVIFGVVCGLLTLTFAVLLNRDFLRNPGSGNLELTIWHLLQSSNALEQALVGGVFGGLLIALLTRVEPDIRPAEALVWPWETVRQRATANISKDTFVFTLLVGTLVVALIALHERLGIQFAAGHHYFGLQLGVGVIGILLYPALRRFFADHAPPGNRLSIHNYLLGSMFFAIIGGVTIGVLGVIFLGLYQGIFYELYRGLPGLLSGWWKGLGRGLLLGLIYGVLSGLVFGCLSRIGLDWRSAQELIKSVKGFWLDQVASPTLRRALVGGLVVGVILALQEARLYGFYDGQQEGVFTGELVGTTSTLTYALLIGTVFALFSLLIGSLSRQVVDAHTRVKPNQGIRNSARNSVLVILVYGSVFGLLIGLVFQFLELSPKYALAAGIVVGLLGGTFIGLPNGLLACLQHGLLRLLLWSSQVMPWRYSRFLDYAAERILLRKVGGGYIFAHRLLLDYFAAQSVVVSSAQRTRLMLHVLPAPVWERVTQITREQKQTQRGISLILCALLVLAALLIPWLQLHPSSRVSHAYPPSQWNLVMNDPLTDNSIGDWIEDNRADSRCTFQKQGYRVGTTTPHSIHWCSAPITAGLTDFAFEVQMSEGVGDGGGILFHDNPDTRSYYYFEVGANGFYRVDLYQHGAYSRTLVQGYRSKIYKEVFHQPILLAVVARGNTFELYVDRHFVTDVVDQDQTLSRGMIALVSGEDTRPTNVLYRNARIWANKVALAGDAPGHPLHAYPPVHWRAALYDPLKDNGVGYWQESNTVEQGNHCVFTTRGYRVGAANEKAVVCSSQNSRFADLTDVALEVRTTLLREGIASAMFRADTQFRTYYHLVISQGGSYRLYRYSNHKYTLLTEGLSAAMHTGLGQANVIGVVARGDIIDLYINHQPVAHVRDKHAPAMHGTIALGAIGFGTPADVLYNDVNVWIP